MRKSIQLFLFFSISILATRNHAYFLLYHLLIHMKKPMGLNVWVGSPGDKKTEALQILFWCFWGRYYGIYQDYVNSYEFCKHICQIKIILNAVFWIYLQWKHMQEKEWCRNTNLNKHSLLVSKGSWILLSHNNLLFL